MSPVAETEIGRRLVDEARALAGAQRGELWGWLVGHLWSEKNDLVKAQSMMTMMMGRVGESLATT